MKVYALYITNPRTGYMSVITFDSPFERALLMVGLASQPVILRCADY